MNKERIRTLISLVLIISLFGIGCGTKNHVSNTVESGKVSATVTEDIGESEKGTVCNLVDVYTKKESDKKYLPKVEEVVPYPYYYLCYDMRKSQIVQYETELLNMKFKLITQENVSDITYNCYADEKKRIVVVEAEDCLIVSISDAFAGMETEENVFSKETIFQLIREEYNNQLGVADPIVSKEYPPEIMIKCWIPELYEKTNFQAYCTFTRNGKETGIYLIAENKACKIQDDLDNICIADLDDDGTSELLSLYGFGSGIYRIHLNVYQYSNPIYYNSLNKVVHCCYTNCFVPKNGYANIAFKKINDRNVHLVDLKFEYMKDGTAGKSQAIYGEDYGKIVITENRSKVALENMSEFPYYEWDQYFVNDTDTKDEKKIEFSDDVPKLTVTIGDTTVENTSWKEVWGTEKENQISFQKLMKDKSSIPSFTCTGMYEYTDEICLSFLDGVNPETIELQDYLITENGETVYGKSGVMERELRYGEDGNYYVGLMSHAALYLSSNTASYTNPSYRGFRVLCRFDEDHVCEYVFVLSVEPAWK